ncbi:hypothetical protein MSAN_01550700 [Mycena sanguinolenta]|uniref:F-box domain-containing protein n=1 Tax=Mycena sanguinolenta TaxID=230812 RepID=A0A8H6Y1Z8_9AGAR|nr:hypothetical protein MSAN_01550700 [Mycena sanguinolenta]
MAHKFAPSALHKLRRIFQIRPSASAVPTSSVLLDLPRELRLQIYDALADLLLDCRVDRTRQKVRTKLATVRSATTRLPIPWLSLMLVCKTISNEMQYHIRGYTTYILEAKNFVSVQTLADRVTWRGIPCPPSNVRTLEANLYLSLMTHCWATTMPTPVVSDLYQVLNCFIHNGPVLTRRRPLTTHIHLNTLILQIHTERYLELCNPPEVIAAHRKKLWQELQWCITRVVEKGVLFGAVDKIVCQWADGQGTDDATEWEVSSPLIGTRDPLKARSAREVILVWARWGHRCASFDRLFSAIGPELNIFERILSPKDRQPLHAHLSLLSASP